MANVLRPKECFSIDSEKGLCRTSVLCKDSEDVIKWIRIDKLFLIKM